MLHMQGNRYQLVPGRPPVPEHELFWHGVKRDFDTMLRRAMNLMCMT